MMTRNLGIAVAGALLLSGCSENAKQAPSNQRVELKRLTGTTVQFVPTQGQLPYCLLFTISEKGVVRQLTMNRYNESVKCTADQPVNNVTFRIPVDEGSIRALVIFTDQKVSAGPISQQILELKETNPKVSALDLRLPGKATTATIDFTPEADQPVVSGEVLGADAGAAQANPSPVSSAPKPSAPDEGTQPASLKKK